MSSLYSPTILATARLLNITDLQAWRIHRDRERRLRGGGLRSTNLTK